MRNTARERDRDRLLREEQDRAFRDSARRDRERIQGRMEEERRKVEEQRRKEEEVKRELEKMKAERVEEEIRRHSGWSGGGGLGSRSSSLKPSPTLARRAPRLSASQSVSQAETDAPSDNSLPLTP
jgi:FAS-associated factor 2